jgi:hypothetical protein
MKKRKIRSDMVVLSSATSVAKRPAPSLKRIRMETSNILGTVTTTNNKDLATRGGPVLQHILRDLVYRISTTPDKAQRKKLLHERKHFWRKELGLTKVDFSGVWVLARNKYNVVMQYQMTRVSNCAVLVMPTSDTSPPLKRILMDSSNILGNGTITSNKDLATRGGSVLQCIFRDLVNRVSTTPDNAQRKKLLNERKHFWRKELGLTKVDFSGVWILARNKYNVVMQYQATRVSNYSALVMPTSDTGPSRVNKADALKQKKKGNSKASNKLRNKKRGPNLNRWSNLCRTGRTRSLEIYRFGDWDFFTPSKI